MVLELLLEVGRARVERRVGHEDDESVGALAEAFVRARDDGDLEDVRVGRERRLDGQA